MLAIYMRGTKDKQQTDFYLLFVGRRGGYTAGVGCVKMNDEGISK
jgi:hypothetical protein